MNALETTASAVCEGPHLEQWFGFLTAYCTGWSKGDAEMIRSAVADDFVWDDPETDRVSKDGLETFLPKLIEAIDDLRDSGLSMPYLTLSDLVVGRSQPDVTVWCCFEVPGTDIHGTSQIRIGNEGVLSEHRTYLKDLPARVAMISDC